MYIENKFFVQYCAFVFLCIYVGFVMKNEKLILNILHFQNYNTIDFFFFETWNLMCTYVNKN